MLKDNIVGISNPIFQSFDQCTVHYNWCAGNCDDSKECSHQLTMIPCFRINHSGRFCVDFQFNDRCNVDGNGACYAVMKRMFTGAE